jgi:hypothetical protein
MRSRATNDDRAYGFRHSLAMARKRAYGSLGRNDNNRRNALSNMQDNIRRIRWPARQ